MSRNDFESGWENPDRHPGLEQRARPMFDPDGKPTSTAPEPEPLTPAERAMFAALEGGAGPAAATGEQEAKREKVVKLAQGGVVSTIRSKTPITIEHMLPVAVTLAKVTRIRELATRALDNPSPAAWAVALSEILRELDA